LSCIMITMNDCLFCNIANGDPSKLVWQNDIAVAFKDIHPKAPVHVLVVPKQHIKNIDNLYNEVLAGRLIMAVREVIKELGLVEANKILIQGIDMDHLHIHVMSDSRYNSAKLPFV
jgi:histidine triad (HIT) family protein